MPSERSFGLSVGTVLLVLAAWSWYRGSESAWLVLAVAGSLLVLSAATVPSLLRGPNRVWWRIALALGWVNSRILLTLFFVLVITPFGLVRRALGRNPLRGARGTTSWGEYRMRIANPHHYDRLY